MHWTCTPEKATHLIHMSCSSSQEERCGQDPVHADTCPKGSAHSTGVPLLQQPRPTRATWQACARRSVFSLRHTVESRLVFSTIDR